MNVYELTLVSEDKSTVPDTGKIYFSPLKSSSILNYARWFCYFRWLVISILTALGIIGFIPGIFQPLGFRSQMGWAFGTAIILTIGNIVFIKHIRRMKLSESINGIIVNLWAQISLDLIILTVVVHFIGSIETFIPFAYLFHIVLACIFFTGRESFGVTVAACILYAACVLTERAGIFSSAGIYSNRNFREYIESNTTVSVINIVSVFGILLVVWYLASHLSAMVREREYELISINDRLEKIQAERTGHMLRTTHELKAPFAAIHANSQLLLKGYCGKLPDNAYDVVLRIAARCRRLTNEIQEMLQLTNLRSDTNESLQWRKLDLAGILEWSIVQVSSVAEERTIEFETDIVPISIYGVEDYLKMLFVNLLSNAVLYSHDSGLVRVKCYRVDGNEAEVIIEDEGIGIPGEKLPRIFDDYYRTDEALRHNKESSGLGLTIVKHVVQTQKINLKVESQPDTGTKFTLLFQSAGKKIKHTNIRGEVQYGLPAGY